MHFPETRARLLEGPLPDLQKNTVQYCQLKKLVDQVVEELSSLGLSPALLCNIPSEQTEYPATLPETHKGNALPAAPPFDICVSDDSSNNAQLVPRVVHELNEVSSGIEQPLRLSSELPNDTGSLLYVTTGGERDDHADKAGNGAVEVDLHGDRLLVRVADGGRSEEIKVSGIPRGDSLPWKLQNLDSEKFQPIAKQDSLSNERIPVVSASQLFELLHASLEHMSTHLKSVEDSFKVALTTLAEMVRDSVRPASSSRSVLGRGFRAYSSLRDNPGAISVRSGRHSQSDLYSWREIFRIYVEVEIFESGNEQDRGERSIEESERRLQLFVEQITRSKGVGVDGRLKQGSQLALETFLQLNIFILDIKKFQLANSEATRKILEKHASEKHARQAAPSDPPSYHTPLEVTRPPQDFTSSLPHILVQAIRETLLPIIPQLDDYSCLICTGIAFKPIRLDCSHLFCVRCLVKMQKRGKDNCPICRSPCVLAADRSNVDWALMNFMQDWFPIEAKEKLKANEKEAIVEQYGEQSLNKCVIM